MTIPANLTTVSLSGTYLTAAGVPAAGAVDFALSAVAADPAGPAIVTPVSVVATLDQAGHFTVALPATDDPAWSSTGLLYRVTEKITGTAWRTYYVALPRSASPSVDLATLAPAAQAPALVSYILATAAGMAGGVATLDGTGQVPASQLGHAGGGGGGAVTSVNGQTGTVVLTAASVGADAAGAAASALATAEAYTDTQVATRAPAARTITTTAPLAGGGSLAADRTLTVAGATTIAAGVVQLAGDLAGTSAAPTVPGLASKAVDSAVVHLAGIETVTGAKTFSVAPVVPAASFPEAAVSGLVADLSALASGVAASQPSDPGLSSLAALTGAGFVVAIGTDTYTVRALAAGDVPSLDAAKITTGVLSGNRIPTPDMVQNLVSGAWYAAPNQGSVGQTGALPAGTAMFVLLVPLRDATLSGVAGEITTVDTGNLRFGLASDSGGQPAAWLDDYGVVVATGTGLVQPASTPARALTAGTRYWIGIVPQGGAGTLVMRARTGADPSIPLTPTSTATPGTLASARTAYTSTGWTAALTGPITIASVTLGPVAEARLT